MSAVDQVTWIGHATALLELDGARVLTDPVLRGRIGHLRRQARPPSSEAIARLDAVLVSHLHGDHLDLPSLRGLAGAPRVIVPRGAGDWLRRSGVEHVEELGTGETAAVGPLLVEAVPAEHDDRRRPFGGGPAADALGYVLRGSRAVYFAGDTDLHDAMEALGALDVALLPVWGWGPTLGEGHLDPQRAARAAALLRPRLAIPIHWGTFYPAGLRRWRPAPLTEPPRRFAAQVAALAPDVEVRVLAPGESTPLPASA
jgi:L-ascorbate metabolism protein UlaG (beta-lactamase superfamily)